MRYERSRDCPGGRIFDSVLPNNVGVVESQVAAIAIIADSNNMEVDHVRFGGNQGRAVLVQHTDCTKEGCGTPDNTHLHHLDLDSDDIVGNRRCGQGTTDCHDNFQLTGGGGGGGGGTGADVWCAAAGDVAENSTCETNAKQTAALIKSDTRIMDDPQAKVFVLGDVQYSGDYSRCYDLPGSWGDFKAKSHPSTGNHDYGSGGPISVYDTYWGPRVKMAGSDSGGGRNYWGTIGDFWGFVSIDDDPSATGATQTAWLDGVLTDPAKLGNRKVIVYHHHPIYIDLGLEINTPNIADVFRKCYDKKVDLYLYGHSHYYGRFPRSGKTGNNDPNGPFCLCIGTGGKSGGDTRTTDFSPGQRERGGRALFATGGYGVLKLLLAQGGFKLRWERVGAGVEDALEGPNGGLVPCLR